MSEKKISTAFQWRLIFLVITVIIFFAIPMKGTGGFIERERAYWPIRLMSDKALFILTNYRTWFIGQWIAFAGTLVLLEPFCLMIGIRKNKIVKMTMLVLFFLCFLTLLYFSIGSVVRLGPFPPMKLGTWLKWFGVEKNVLYIWWVVSGVFLQLGSKF